MTPLSGGQGTHELIMTREAQSANKGALETRSAEFDLRISNFVPSGDLGGQTSFLPSVGMRDVAQPAFVPPSLSHVAAVAFILVLYLV